MAAAAAAALRVWNQATGPATGRGAAVGALRGAAGAAPPGVPGGCKYSTTALHVPAGTSACGRQILDFCFSISTLLDAPQAYWRIVCMHLICVTPGYIPIMETGAMSLSNARLACRSQSCYHSAPLVLSCLVLLGLHSGPEDWRG